MTFILRFLIRVFLLRITTGVLVLFSLSLEELKIWQYLTNFFVIIRTLLSYIDFVIDTETLIRLVGISFILQVAYWTLKGVLFLSRFFKSA